MLSVMSPVDDQVFVALSYEIVPVIWDSGVAVAVTEKASGSPEASYVKYRDSLISTPFVRKVVAALPPVAV